MGSFCGTNPQTVTQTATNPNVTNQQNAIYGMVNQYAADFGGVPSALIAPQNQLQTSAEQGVANNAYANQPWNYIGQGMIGQGASTTGQAPSLYGQGATTLGGVNPLSNTAWNPTAYESPYTQDVIGATMANIQRQNAIQQNGALGNAIASGNAFGGDRAGVAAAELARNQELAANQTMAGLSQANFNQASQQANAQQQYLLNLGLGNNAQLMQQAGLYGNLGAGLTQAGLGMGSLGSQAGYLGNAGQGSTLNALQGLYNMGTGLQNTQQQMLSAPLTLGSWWSSASPGVNTVPTSTTYPGASPAGSIAGLGLTGLAGANLFQNLGGLGALGGLLGGGAAAGGAGAAASDLGPLLIAGAALNRGGRIGDHHHDLLSRYHHIRSALRRDAGGPAGMPQMAPANPLLLASNVPQSQQMPTTQAYQRQRMYGLMQRVGNAAAPEAQQAAEQMLATQQAHSGGAIHKDAGGETVPDQGLTAPSSPTLAGSMSVADLGPEQKLDAFKRLMKLAHRGADLLTTPNTSASDPTKAPNAPGQGQIGITPTQALTLAKLGSNSTSSGTTFPSSNTDDSMWVARGGRTLGDLGRQHFDDGGGADQARQDYQQDMEQDAADNVPQSPSGGGGGFDPYRYMPKPTPYQSAMQSPWMALLAGGLGMMSQAGARDAHGLPISGAAQIGRGGLQGVEYMEQQRKYDLEQRRVALEAMARQQAAAQLAQQADIARGVVNGHPTLQALQQAETIRRENLPQWVPGAGGRDFYGNPIGGWVQPNLAPGATQYQPPTYPGHPGAGTPSTAAPAVTGSPSSAAPAGTTRVAPGVYVPETVSSPDADLQTMQGQEFLTALKQRHPAEAAVVEGIIRGDVAPSDPRVRGAQGQHYLTWAMQADPSFNAALWPLRLQTQKSFAPGGKYAQLNASAGMLVGHMDKLADLADQLHNWQITPEFMRRYIANPFAENFEPQMKSTINQYRQQQELVAKELTKLLAGPGGGTLEELNANKARFDPALGGQTLRDTIHGAMGQMEQRLLEGSSQYNQVMGTTKGPRDFMAPEHRVALENLEKKLGHGQTPLSGKIDHGSLLSPTGAGAAAVQGRPIASMSIEELKTLNPKAMTPEQLREASQRLRMLSQPQAAQTTGRTVPGVDIGTGDLGIDQQ